MGRQGDIKHFHTHKHTDDTEPISNFTSLTVLSAPVESLWNQLSMQSMCQSSYVTTQSINCSLTEVTVSTWKAERLEKDCESPYGSLNPVFLRDAQGRSWGRFDSCFSFNLVQFLILLLYSSQRTFWQLNKKRLSVDDRFREQGEWRNRAKLRETWLCFLQNIS